MGIVNCVTNWCTRCNQPTLHRLAEGLEDGETYTIGTCARCEQQVRGEAAEAAKEKR